MTEWMTSILWGMAKLACIFIALSMGVLCWIFASAKDRPDFLEDHKDGLG